MGFLQKLWEETIAGPAPDSGLAKLRKYNSFSAARYAADHPPVDDHLLPVSRTITVVRSKSAAANRNLHVDTTSAPPSPASTGTPTSPFSPSSPGGNFKKLGRRRSAANPKNPPAYDWIV